MSFGTICQHTGCRQYARWNVSSADAALETLLCDEHRPDDPYPQRIKPYVQPNPYRGLRGRK